MGESELLKDDLAIFKEFIVLLSSIFFISKQLALICNVLFFNRRSPTTFIPRINKEMIKIKYMELNI